MLKTLKGILKTGDATVKYPFAPIEQAPSMMRCVALLARHALRRVRRMRFKWN